MKWDYSQEQTGDVGKDAKQAYDTNHECIFHINISPFFDPVLEIFRSYSAALLRKSFFVNIVHRTPKMYSADFQADLNY